MSGRARRLVIVLAVVLGLWGLWTLARPDGATWARVTRDDLLIAVDVTGHLEALDTTRLGPPPLRRTWNFEIAYLIEEGTEVEAGARVLEFDTSKLEETLEEKRSESEQARAEIDKLASNLEIRRRDTELELAEAAASLELAELKLARPDVVVAANEIAEVELDVGLAREQVRFLERSLELLGQERTSSLRTLEQRRDRAVARVVEIEQQIEAMTVTAPHSGTVIYVSENGEDKPKIGDSVWRGAKVLEIPDLSKMKAVGEVEEIVAGRLREGQAAEIRLDAHPDLTFPAKLASIERSVRQRSDADPTKVFRVHLELATTDTERMRPGMRFRGSIEIERIVETLLVPAAAVFGSSDGPLVYRRSLGRVAPVHPEVGKSSDSFVQVLDGLDAGDRVALEPPARRAR